MNPHYWDCSQHESIKAQARALLEGKHLRDLLKDEKRNDALYMEADGLCADFSRQLVDLDIVKNLLELAGALGVQDKIKEMFDGHAINQTEKRAVLHVALRCDENSTFKADGKDVAADVLEVRRKIAQFANDVRNGVKKGFTDQVIRNVVCIGIGGSYLGVEFVHESFKTDPACSEAAKGRQLRFLANVDPIDVDRAMSGLNIEETLFVIISKTFTTAETMLNARTAKDRILRHYNNDARAVEKHMCAVSTNLEATSKFGIATENVFGFWDWVGGRFSVCSAVGLVPLCLQYGPEKVDEFLAGCRAMDNHFANSPLKSNLPFIFGLLSWYNATYLDLNCVAVLPYCQALLRFPAHIQQLAMESNGKRVCLDGTQLPQGLSGEMYFGEPGTNGQHSFYQLLHQGRRANCEFIGFSKSQSPIKLDGEPVSNHDELMSNFFAQPDALALGKTEEELKAEGVKEELIPHKIFSGNRPSTCLLFLDSLTPYRVGQLLALYEHRTVSEGFMWGLNSFDQWGVELGKVLAKEVRCSLSTRKINDNFPSPTARLLGKYLANA